MPGELLLEREVQDHLQGVAIPVKREHHRNSARHNQAPDAVHARALDARPEG